MHNSISGREVYFWLAVVLIVYFAVAPTAAKVSMAVLLVSVIAFGVVPKVMTALKHDVEERQTQARILMYRLILLVPISLSLAFVIVFTQ